MLFPGMEAIEMLLSLEAACELPFGSGSWAILSARCFLGISQDKCSVAQGTLRSDSGPNGMDGGFQHSRMLDVF